MPAEVKGLAQKHEYPHVKVGPKDFEWPAEASRETRKKFAASLHELLNQKRWTYMKLAEVCFGRQAYKGDDFRPPRNVQLIRNYVKLKAFPTVRAAGFIAQALGVSMARLLEPTGPHKPLGKHRSNGAGNGLATESHDPPPPPPPPMPKNAKPPIVQMATNKDDPRFSDVTVTKGTLPIEVAMSLYALIHPRSQ